MAQDKSKGRHGMAAVEDKPVTTTEVPVTEASATTNFVLAYRREHPGNRCSYGIAGVPGIVVIDRGLLADPTFTGPITLDVPLALPRVDNKQAKAEAAAARAQEKALKAQQRIEAAAAKATERQAKADAALAAAKAKVEAAVAAKAKEAIQ